MQHQVSLSGSVDKSGPLDFGTKNKFPSTYVSGKGLTHIYGKAIYYFPIPYFLLCYEPNLNFGFTEVSDRDKKGKIQHICEACYSS